MWILEVCTAGWVLCGQVNISYYPTEAQCYRAMDSLYRQHSKKDFKYIVCKPKELNDPATRKE